MKHPAEMTLSEIRALLWNNITAQSMCAGLAGEVLAEQDRIKKYQNQRVSEQIVEEKTAREYERSLREKKRREQEPDFTLPEE